MSTIQQLSISDTDLNLFYQIGAAIRQKVDRFELPWSDCDYIKDFAETNNAEFGIWASKNNELQGRVAAYYFKDESEVGYIGWYECEDSSELSTELLDAASSWLKSNGINTVYGPINGSSWFGYRFNLKSEVPRYAGQPYQPSFYVDHWSNYGFENEYVYESNLIPAQMIKPMNWQGLEQILQQMGLVLEYYPMGLTDEQVEVMRQFYNDCFEDNPLFRPINFKDYKELTAAAEKYADKKHSYIIRDQAGEVVCVLISLTDVYHGLHQSKTISDSFHEKPTLYMKTIATAAKWRNNKLSQMLVNLGCNEATEHGYDRVVFASMYAGNWSAIKSKENFGAQNMSTYAVMKKDI